MSVLELQGLLLIREKINLIKNKPHGPDVAWLISLVEEFLNEKTPTAEIVVEDSRDARSDSD